MELGRVSGKEKFGIKSKDPQFREKSYDYEMVVIDDKSAEIPLRRRIFSHLGPVHTCAKYDAASCATGRMWERATEGGRSRVFAVLDALPRRLGCLAVSRGIPGIPLLLSRAL